MQEPKNIFFKKNEKKYKNKVLKTKKSEKKSMKKV